MDKLDILAQIEESGVTRATIEELSNGRGPMTWAERLGNLKRSLRRSAHRESGGTVSDLSTYTRISPNTSGIRTAGISKITVHHMAGNCSIETCGEIFANPSRQASSNYGIGTDGRIGCYLPEEFHPWTSSSYWNDDRAITVECANTSAGVYDGTWEISDQAMDSLVALCADICTRYGFRMKYTGTTSGSLTRHNFYASTNCPGPYIERKTAELVERVNRIVDGGDMDLSDKTIDKIMIRIWEYIFHKGKADEDKTLQDAGYEGKWSNRYNVLNAAFSEAHEANERAKRLEEKVDAILGKLA